MEQPDREGPAEGEIELPYCEGLEVTYLAETRCLENTHNQSGFRCVAICLF